MFEGLLNIIKKDFIFPGKGDFEEFDINSLTTKRVLLSDDFYDFLEYYSITSKLQEKIYEIYYFDDKKITMKTDEFTFNDSIFKKISVKDEFHVSKFWQLDSDSKVLRKYSEQIIAPQGRFYEKNDKESYQEIIETKIKNAELLLTRFKYKSEEENFENFNWFYGKQPQTDGYTIRFYLNIMPDVEKIANLVNVIFTEFDNAGVPFIFKYLSDPEKFNGRSDVAVLYAPRKNALLVFDLVRIIYEKTYDASFYCESSPLFTEPLARGVSFGENPDDRRFTSFGSYRSIYIAMAIIKFYYIDEKNKLPNEDGLKELLNSNLEKSYADNKNKLPDESKSKVLLNSNLGKSYTDNKNKKWTDTFYLNQNSNYNYLKEIRYFKRNKFQHFDSSQRNSNNLTITPTNRKSDFLIVANLVAQIISREANFYPSKNQKYYMHCNWISYTSTNFFKIDVEEDKKQIIGYEFKALNNDFLEGRLGVAYFMRQFFRLKDDQNIYRIYYRTFQGAIESLKDNNELTLHLDELKWFYEQNKDGLLKKVKFTLFLRETADSIPPVFMIAQRNNLSELHKIIDKVVSTDFVLSSSETDIIKSVIQDLKEEKPFTNFYGNEEMCLSISSGYALLGYFFLRLYDKKAFSSLPFQFEDK